MIFEAHVSGTRIRIPCEKLYRTVCPSVSCKISSTKEVITSVLYRQYCVTCIWAFVKSAIKCSESEIFSELSLH